MNVLRTSIVMMLSVSICLAAGAQAQSSGASIWRMLEKKDLKEKADLDSEVWIQPSRFQTVELDPIGLDASLAGVPKELAGHGGLILELPTPDGSLERFSLVESPIMEPGLEEWFADQGWPMKTFKGISLDREATTMRMDWGGPAGLHAMVASPENTYYIDPYFKNNRRVYASYLKQDYGPRDRTRTCHVGELETRRQKTPKEAGAFKVAKAGPGTNGNLRVYRLAVAATAEYTAIHGGTQVGGQAAIATTINRVNEIYERDLAVRMVLVGNNNQLVYLNDATDPYMDGDVGMMTVQNQANIDLVIGTANYDIGHVFGTAVDPNGGALPGVSCDPNDKAQGATVSDQPLGDPFDVDFVSHELGHQWGATHTFNSTTWACGGGRREGATAYEPGSGSTIMAYASLCGVDDLQANSDDFFHGASLDQMLTYIVGGGACSVNMAAGNPNAPTVTAPQDYVIPIETPFELIAESAEDLDGDSISFAWEEFDLGPAATLAAGDNGSSPLFRAWSPNDCPIRTIPRIDDLVNGTTALGESLPVTSRAMTFRVTARDNHPGGGRLGEDHMTVTSTVTAGPFEILEPNGGETWSGTRVVRWDVAGTNGGLVDAREVDILLSWDGGLTWPLVLNGGTPNDGSQAVTFPAMNTSKARIKIKGSGNIFFDISDADFSLSGRNCSFSDVDPSEWYSDFVQYSCNQGVVSGYSDSTFRPGNETTRAEVLKMAYEAAGSAVDCPGPDPGFVDVEPSHWFYPYVADAKAKGIVEGSVCPGGRCFFPNSNVSRAEALKIISLTWGVDSSQHANYINIDLAVDGTIFPDVTSSQWFHPYVTWMANAELSNGPFPEGITSGERVISGYPDGLFRPNDFINRAEVAKLVSNTSLYFSSGSSPVPPPIMGFRGTSYGKSGNSGDRLGLLFEQPVVIGNISAPEEILLPGGNNQVALGPVEISGATHDPDGDRLFYFWSADEGSLTADDPDLSSVTWTPPGSVGSTTTFTVTGIAGDGRGKISRSVFSFTVQGDGSPNTPPTISVTSPSEADEVATSSYTIKWTDDDPDSDATISLFYDNNNSGNNGTPIAGAGSLSESSSLDQFSWDTSSITPGTYYIYARIDDGLSSPVYSYSQGTVKVEAGSPSSPSDPLNWRLVDFEPGAKHFGIGYGNNTYLAVGRDTLINRSHGEGFVWGQYSNSSLPDDFDIYDAHYANGRWILVGEQGVGGWLIYSDNLSEGTSPDFTTSISWFGDVLHDIHYGDGIWVAVGEPSLVIYSTNNGSTWQEGNITGGGNFDFQAVDYDDSTDTWIAVSDSSSAQSQVATSNDGIHWQRRSLSLSSQERLRGISVEGGVAVAVGAKTISGDHSLILTSHDGGDTWTNRTVGTDALNDVVYYPEGWVAVGNGTVALSQDGVNWESHKSNLGKNMVAAVYSADKNRLMSALHSQIHRAQSVGASQHYLLEITVARSGTVTGMDNRLCRDYCANSYIEGDSFTLVAEPDDGYLLKRWVGGDCTNSNASRCDVALTESVDIWAVFEVDDPPTLSILEPNGVLDKTRESFTIRWSDDDPDSNATIQFFRDQDGDGTGGTLINPSVVLEDEASDQYIWDTSALPEGDYYVYGVIDDGVNPSQTAVSAGPVTIIHNTPPSLSILEPDGAGDTVDLTFDLVWTDEDPDNDASISFFYDSDNSGADGTPIPEAQDLSEDDPLNTVQWDVSGLPEQDFYVYGVIDDGVMDPETVYSSGPITVLHVSTNTPPSLSFVEPNGVDDVADLEFQILWTDEDPDNNAQIHLFYDIDGSGADGQSIFGPINEDDESDQWVWDTSALENGDYFIYAVIDDHVRPPVTVYSPSPVTVIHGNAVPSLTIHEPSAGTHPADQTFTITWSDEDPDNDATIAFYYDRDGSGADDVLIVDGLSEDDETDSYVWNVSGMEPGDYYVYASVDDGEHTAIEVYSQGMVSIDHPSYSLSWTAQGLSTRRDRINGVAVDSQGNSYVTGYFESDFQFGDLSLTHDDDADTFLVKLDPNGSPVWARTFGGERDDFGMGVAVDGLDNVYLTGYFEDQMQFDSTTLTAVGRDDIYVAKLNSSGVLQWVERFGVSGYSKSLGIDVTLSGEVYFAGTFTEQIDIGTTMTVVGDSDVFIGKLSTHGSVLWGRRGGGPSTSYNEEAHGITVDSNGNAYITGQFMQTADFGGHSITAETTYNPDIFVVRYNSNGSVRWAKSAGSDGFNRGTALAASADGYVYATGWFEREATFGNFTLIGDSRPDVYLAKYSASSGSISWVAHAEGPGDDRGYGVDVTPGNDVVLTGKFVTSLQLEDARIDGRGGFAALYSPSGGLKWARPVGTVVEFANYASAKAIAADGLGGAWVAGEFSSTVRMDRDTLTSMGDSDVYLARIAPSPGSNAAPSFSFIEPDGSDDSAAGEFSVQWIDEDIDDNARILLFVDNDGFGFDGDLLTPSAISEDDEADEWIWDVSDLPTGDYYLYAQITDGVNPILRVYAEGPVTVVPGASADLSVSSAPQALPEPGGISQLSIQLTNQSLLVPITVSSLSDDLGTLNERGDCEVPVDVMPSTSYICSYPISIQGSPGTMIQHVVSASWSAEGTTGSLSASEVLSITDALPIAAVSKTAAPSSIPEPGGLVTFLMTVENLGTESLTLVSLLDDVYGDLSQEGTCLTPQVVLGGGSYSCTSGLTVTGDSGEVDLSTVTATLMDDEGNTTSPRGSVSVTITNVASSISVSKSPIPALIAEPGADVTFKVRIDNTSPADSVTITNLLDDAHGNLAGKGTCAVPQTINLGEFYECTYISEVLGNAGDSETSSIAVSGIDDDSVSILALGTTTVEVTDVLPQAVVTKTSSPNVVDEPGGEVVFEVQVTNSSNAESLELTNLTDDIQGELNGLGTCTIPQTLASGSSYICSYPAWVEGNAGNAEVSTVTADISDDDGNSIAPEGTTTVTIAGTDWGDALGGYPTLASDNGASHTIVAGFFLGESVDADTDGQPTVGADGDDLDGGAMDDEDGVHFLAPLVPGVSAQVEVTASQAGMLDAWIDFNGNGSWADPGERVFNAEALNSGINTLSFSVPPSIGTELLARFRFSSTGGLSIGGLASDGEVEDLRLPIDMANPEIVAVGSVPDSGDGVVDACETLQVEIEELTVVFSELMHVGGGPSAADDSANYRLVVPGPDFTLDTLDCSDPMNDDGELAFTSVSYLADVPISGQATVRLRLSEPLVEAQSRLWICGTLEDHSGNPLEGGDYSLDFRADASNLFQNGHFDCTSQPWLISPPDISSQHDTIDVNESENSGSLKLLEVADEPVAIGDCVAVSPSTPLSFGGSFRVDAEPGAQVQVLRECGFFAEPGCQGLEIDSYIATDLLEDTQTAFVDYESSLLLGESVLSALCTYSFQSLGSTLSPSVFLDRLFAKSTGEIFADGFESGDTSAWTPTP